MRKIHRLTAHIALVVGLAGCGASYHTHPEQFRDQHGKVVEYQRQNSDQQFSDPEPPYQDYSLEGLLDAHENPILPLEFRMVLVLGPEWALVQRVDKSYGLAKLPSGAFDGIKYAERSGVHEYLGDATVNYLLSNVRPDGRFDVTIFDAAGPRAPIKDVCGPSVPDSGMDKAKREAIHIYGSVLVVHSTTPEGDAVSRLHRLDGSPVTPFVPRLVSIPYHVPGDVSSVEKLEWAVPTADLGDPELPSAKLFDILGEDGKPLRLPPGAVGMIPIPVRDLFHAGWAIVYSTAEGRRYAVGSGRPAEVVARAKDLPLLDGLRRINLTWTEDGGSRQIMRFFARKRVGQPSWELVSTENFGVVVTARAGETLATVDALVTRFQALQAEELAQIRARVAEEERRRAEEEAAYKRARFAGFAGHMKAGNRNEARLAVISGGGAAEWTAYLEKFGPMDWGDVSLAKAAGVPKEVSDRAEASMRRADAANGERQLREERIRREGYAPVVDPLKAWDSAFRAGMQQQASEPDPVIQRQRQLYYQNLQKWNNGEQSWH